MKTKLHIFFITLAALSFNVQTVLAQIISTTAINFSATNKDSTRLALMDKYSTTYYGVVVDSATKDPIQSAVVYLVGTAPNWGKDLISRSVVTDKKGRFEILVSGDSKLEVSCLGYKLYTRRVSPPSGSGFIYRSNNGIIEKPSVDLGKISLAPDLYNVDEAVVKARIQMFEQKGDTTRIFPKLVKTMEGDALIEVLKQIPGFKIEEDGTIYENGRKIERTYINNTLLFGKDPRIAFLKLSAESALAIDTYEEKVDEAEAALTNRNEDTRRVANITTTRKIDSYTTMEWLAESGLDHDKDIDGSRNIRYGLAGDIGFYKVGKNLSIQASHSNLVAKRFTSGDNVFFKGGNPQETKITISGFTDIGDSVYNEKVKRNLYKQKGYLNGRYYYNNQRHSNMSGSKSTYFPSVNFDSQIIETANSIKSKSQSHDGSITYAKTGTFPISISLNPTFAKNEYFSESQNTTITDGKLLSKTSQINKTIAKPINLSGNIFASKSIYHEAEFNPNDTLLLSPSIPTLRIGFSGSFRYANNDNDQVRDYELTDKDGTNLTTLSVDADNPSIETNVETTLSYSKYKTFKDKDKSGYNKRETLDIGIGLKYSYDKDKNYSIAINQATGEVDEAYSGDYVRNNTKTALSFNFRRTWKSGLLLQSAVSYSNTEVKSDETIPNKVFISKNFDAVNYSLSLRYNMLALDIDSENSIPFANQLSNILSNENPMSLSAGNPNLESGRIYKANLSFSNRSYEKTRKVNIQTGLSYQLYTDPITMIRRYFGESTILSEYGGYEVAAGATLNTPMNVGNYYQLSGNLKVSYLLQKINTTFGCSVSSSYRNPLSSVDNELIRNESSNANVEFTIISTPTRKIRVNLTNRTTFSWQENEKYSDRSRTNNLNASVRFDFLTRFTFTPTFVNTYQKAYTTGQTLERNALNLSLGARMLKKRNGLLSINVYNLFNDNSGYNLNSTDQYISESWNQLFARFYSISFQYKFNSLDHKK